MATLTEATTFKNLSIREICALDDITRIAYVEEDYWFPYRRANDLLRILEKLLKHPKTYRMPCLAIVGRGNCGKTMLLREFEKRHTPRDRPLRETASVPVLYVQAPPQADRQELYNAILDALHIPYRVTENPGRKLSVLLHIMRQVNVQILMLDEVSQVTALQKRQMTLFLNSIKHICNELCIPIVIGGTEAAATAVKNDAQFASRFDVEVLRAWQLDNDFLRLLKTLEERSVLLGEVNLATPEIAPLLHGLSEGILGDLVRLLRLATIKAIETGIETITAELIRSIDWTPPSIRKSRLNNTL